MASRIEDYALLGDTESAALVGKDGSIDWLTVPRFDSPACFAALLGNERQRPLADRTGRPDPAGGALATGRARSCSRRCSTPPRGRWRSSTACHPRDGRYDLVRLVEGRSGRVPMRLHLTIRFDYGSIVPWVRRCDGGIARGGRSRRARAWPPRSTLHGENFDDGRRVHRGGRRAGAVRAHLAPVARRHPSPSTPSTAIAETRGLVAAWSSGCTYDGRLRRRGAVARSPSSRASPTRRPAGIVAAATTSLPEAIGGARNWDYRYCWLRDATFTPQGPAERRLHDEAAAPGATGCCARWPATRAAADHVRRRRRATPDRARARLARRATRARGPCASATPRTSSSSSTCTARCSTRCTRAAAAASPEEPTPRGACSSSSSTTSRATGTSPTTASGRSAAAARHFTHSKVMAWVAVDRAIAVGRGLRLRRPARPLEAAARRHPPRRPRARRRRPRRLRPALRQPTSSTPACSWSRSSASCPPDDERVRGTVDRHRAGAHRGRLRAPLPHARLRRHRRARRRRGRVPLCSFWLADNYALLGRHDEAAAMLRAPRSALRNDVGLLSEEYDPRRQAHARQLPAGLLARRPREHRRQCHRVTPGAAGQGRRSQGPRPPAPQRAAPSTDRRER